jgi:hypothetical protein
MLVSAVASLEVVPAADTADAPSPQIAAVVIDVTPEFKTRDGSAMNAPEEEEGGEREPAAPSRQVI